MANDKEDVDSSYPRNNADRKVDCEKYVPT